MALTKITGNVIETGAVTSASINTASIATAIANDGLVANSSGIFVNASDGLHANSSGVRVLASEGLHANSSGVRVLANNGLSANSSGTFVVGGTGVTSNATGIHIGQDVSTTSDVTFANVTQTASIIGTHAITSNTTHLLLGSVKLDAVDTAIANLVASAPGTLDTLNEIATALGSDPDLANTLTTSIATKAPLANPSFTGNVSITGTISAAALSTTLADQDIDMDGTSSGQVRIDGNSYTGAIALGTTGMALYHNSATRSLILGTDETARLTITGGGDATFSSSLTASTNLYIGSESKRLSTDGSGELGVGYNQTSNTNLFTVYSGTTPQFRINADGNLSGTVTIQGGTGTTSQSELQFTNLFDTAYLRSKYTDPSATTETYLAFHTNTAGATNGTVAEQMRIAGNKVGIGTTDPQGKFHVVSNSSGYSALIGRYDSDDGLFLHSDAQSTHYNWLITTQDNVNKGFEIIPSDTVGARDFNTPLLTMIADSRFFGVGKTPDHAFEFKSTNNDTWMTINGPASYYTGLKLFRGNGNWGSTANNHFGLLVSDIGLEVSKFTGANATGRSQIMVFDGANERVGINMNAPAYDLDVNGTFAFRQEAYAYQAAMYWYNGSSYLKIQNNGSNVGEIGMTGASQDIRLQPAGGNTRVGGHMIMENSGDYYQVTGSSGTAWTFSGGGQIAGAGSATPGTGSVALGIHHWNGAGWDTPFTIMGGTGATAHNVKIGRTASSLGEARKLNVYSDSLNNDGIHTINYNGANFYKNCGHWSTGSSSTVHLHLKTNISTNNIMFRAHMHGYNYGTASIIDSHYCGYAYSSGSVIATQAIHNGGDVNQAFTHYLSSDGYVVLLYTVGNSAYYCGVILDMEFAQPTGYNHLFEISAATWATTTSAQY